MYFFSIAYPNRISLYANKGYACSFKLQLYANLFSQLFRSDLLQWDFWGNNTSKCRDRETESLVWRRTNTDLLCLVII